mgnify:CR=1 FL=1
MAFNKCKGTLLKVEVASVSTTVAQVMEITPPKSKSLDFEAETLDQAGVGVPRELTGGTDTDPFSATLFWDPVLAVQAAIQAAIDTPAKTVWQLLFVNAEASTIDWNSAGLEFGAVVAARDGLKAELSGNIDGLPVFTE